MSTLNEDIRGRAVRETPAWRASVAPGADAIAQSALETWQQIAAQLEPVIGARGMDALFSRSVHLVGSTYGWLETSAVHGNGAVSLADFKTCLESREAPVAAAAASALLATFTELLANLIGESLSTRLLEVVWMPSPSEAQKEALP